MRFAWYRPAAPAAAVASGVVVLAACLASVPLDSLTHQPGTGGPLADALVTAVAVLPATAVAALLAARRPGNPIGWLTLAIILLGFSPASEYVVLDYRMHHGTLPLGALAVVLQECWPLFLVLVAILLWLFPDGTLPSGRWRRPAAVLIGAGVLAALGASAHGLQAVVAHDVRVDADGDLANPVSPVPGVLSLLVIAGTVASLLAWLVVQVPRYRHAGGERRQQLKWLYSGAAIFVACLLTSVFAVPLAMGRTPGWGIPPVVHAVTNIGSSALPVCMGVAVLKYRLYELDRIISRVVSYALITGLLVGVYAGLVLLATHVLPHKSAVAVAISTLVTAALFAPVRRRVQRVVDRRFNRSRYDAEAVVTAFTARLRHTVDLEAVRHDLLGVTDDAFKPAHVSVWLAPAPAPGPAPAPPR